MDGNNHRHYRRENNAPVGDERRSSPLPWSSQQDKRTKICNKHVTKPNNIGGSRIATMMIHESSSNSDKRHKGEMSRRRQRSRSRDRCVAAQSSLLRRRTPEGVDAINNNPCDNSENHENQLLRKYQGNLPKAQAAWKNGDIGNHDDDGDEYELRGKQGITAGDELLPALREESPVMEFYFWGAVAGEELSERDYSHWLGFLSIRNGGLRYLQDDANLLKVMNASVYDE